MQYTLEIRELVQTPNFKIFDFDYDLYDNNFKPEFEKQFIEYFFFREIGFETIGRFKKALQIHLSTYLDYYTSYYQTILAQKTNDFMTNKHYTETTTRTLKDNDINNTKFITEGNETTNTVDKNTSTSNTTAEHKESDTPQGSIDNLENYMSFASKDSNINTSQGEDNTTTTGSNTTNGTNSTENNRSVDESITVSGSGSIGIVTNSDMLKQWRGIIESMNLFMFEKMDKLFMQIF